MIITLKIDLEKSGDFYSELLDNEGVEIIELHNTKGILLIDGTTHHVKEGIIKVERLMKERNEPPFMNLLTDLVHQPTFPAPICMNEIGDIDIFHYAGYNSSWFIHLLSLTSKKARFKYLVAILMWMSRLFTFKIKEPFIKTLFYRKCFMVLKDFRNIRRCYNF